MPRRNASTEGSGRPVAFADIWAELLARRGYARRQAADDAARAWTAAVGEGLAGHTRVGRVSRGTLELFVASSALVQELTYRQAELLASVQREWPEGAVKRLKFRVAALA